MPPADTESALYLDKPEQVDRFLESWVEPVLAKHRTEASERVGAPEVRV